MVYYPEKNKGKLRWEDNYIVYINTYLIMRARDQEMAMIMITQLNLLRQSLHSGPFDKL